MNGRFSRKESVSGISQVKSSVQRGIRQAIVDQMPLMKENNEELAEELLPKKTPMSVAKCQNHITIIVMNGQPLFFQIRDGPYLPTLKLLHKCLFLFFLSVYARNDVFLNFCFRPNFAPTYASRSRCS